MKKLLVISLLAFAASGFSQDSQAAQPGQSAAGAQGGQGAQQGQGSQQKTIKDPAEYNAYMSAVGQASPAAKAQALESFLQSYPNTVVKEETLEQLMAAYQQAGDQAKMNDAANRLLQVNPNNIRALALLTYSLRAQGASSSNPQQAAQLYAQAAQFAQRGLQAAETMPRAQGVSDADYKKLQDGVRVIFNGAIGMDALQRKDYATAQKALSTAVSVPEDANNLQDVYPLATAYLTATPPDYINGLFYAARATDLAAQNPAAQQQINKFALYYYKKYHGGTDGWDQVLQQAQNSPTPPQGFTIAQAPPPPTPCEFADTIMKNNPDVSQMAYGDWLFVLGSGNEKDAQQVWTYLQGKGLPVSSQAHPAKVINATADELQLATTDDDIQENKADVTLKMKIPLPAAKVPQPGTMLAGEWVGIASSYTPLPKQGQEGAAGNAAGANGTGPNAQQGAAGANGEPGAAGGQQAAGANGQQQQGAGCLPNSGGGVMLTLTDGLNKSAAPARKPAPRRGTTTRRRPSAG